MPQEIEGARWVPLTQGKWTLVDGDVFKDIENILWYVDNGEFARTNEKLLR